MDEQNKIKSTWKSQRTIHKGHEKVRLSPGKESEQKRCYSRQRPGYGDGEGCG